MATNPIPTLTSKGWVSDPESKADYLLSYYFTSDYSQSNLYKGQISSLQYQIQQWGNNDSLIQNNLADSLERYLAQYFDNANVVVTVTDPTSTTDARLTVRVSAMVTQGGKTYSLGRLVSFLNSKIIAIMNLNNGTTTALNT